jgi:hypothetical protein
MEDYPMSWRDGFHSCIVLEMSTIYELVLAADLPELVDALRYLAPLIRR